MVLAILLLSCMFFFAFLNLLQFKTLGSYSDKFKLKVWNQFCEGRQNVCKAIDKKCDIKQLIETNDKIASLFQEFVQFRINFFIKHQSFFKKIGLNKYFYFLRNRVGYLPINAEYNYYRNYRRLLKEISSKNGKIILSDGLRYYHLYSAISMMFNKGHQRTFDSKFRYAQNLDNLFDSLSQYLIDEMNHFVIDKDSNKTLTSNLLNNVFSDHKSEFDKLLQYCIQDIVDAKDYQTEGDMHLAHTRLKHYITHRLTYTIFNDLFVNGDKKEYPNLQLLFKIISNFSIYFACYPNNTDPDAECFYISQFGLLTVENKDLFYDIEGFNEIRYFQYFVATGEGSLLHKATYQRMNHYCQLLINCGFDYKIENGVYYSSYKIATAYGNTIMQSKYENLIALDNEAKEVCLTLTPFCCRFFFWIVWLFVFVCFCLIKEFRWQCIQF